MDTEVKQRNRRRKRAQRMQAQRQSQKVTSLKDGDSENDGSPVREKPQRPPLRRKKSKEPLVEEDIIDGFAILGFRSYDDLEAVIKLASKAGIRRLTSNVVEEKLKTEKESQRNLSITNNHHHHHHHHHHISALPPTVVVTHQNPGLTLTHDPGTSDDSGRASERLTGSSVAPRDPDSSRDRLSDASSRCSSGKGYICDSEGEDDKGSDAGSVLFASTPSARKLDFPSALSISNGDSTTPVSVSAPTPPSLQPPAPSPTAAALPPPQPQYSCPPSSAAITAHTPPRLSTPPAPPLVAAPLAAVPPASVPVTMPQPAAAAAPAPAAHLAPALDSTPDVNHGRTDSPAVATSATNVAVAPGSTGQYPAFPSLYAPYASSPYTAPSPAAVTLTASPRPPSTTSSACVPPGVSTVTTVTTTSHRDTITSARTHSPRGHSPTRERDSYSSNVSSLSRGSVTPFSSAPSTIAVSSSLTFSKPVQQQSTVAGWPPQGGGGGGGCVGVGVSAPTNTAPTSQLSPAPPRPTPPLPQNMHTFPAPMFAPPLPPPVSTASPLGLPQNQVPNPNPFSAESLFQSNQTDMLRRELDSRFLASQDRSINVGPPPYLRTEMHQHQHHHTHVHQHTTPLLPPPPPSSTLFPTPMQFKEIPKMGSVDSPFYRQNIGIGSYPGYSPGLLHPGISGSTPFVPPNHLPPFQPKQPMGDAPKPKPTMKTGKWNAMHVRVAWEIYHHQQKQQSEVKAGTKADLLRPPSHMFPGSLIHSARPHEMFPPSLATHRPPGFDHQPHPGSLFSNPPSHLVVNGTAGSGISPFTRYGTAFNAPGSPFSMSPFPSARDMPPMGPLHDPWGRLQRFPPAPVPQPPWGLKPDPAVLERREQEERERERERERLRREREDRERREREEKQRKQLEQQQQERERERERREKERREHERREMERERERERERMLHQQRIQESKQHAAAAAMAARDRSPLRNGDQHEVRVKEEPRSKDDDVVMLTRTDHRDHRFHPYLNRHPQSPMHTMLDRSRGMLPPGLGGPMPSHFPPPPSSHWPGPDPFRDPYRFEPLRYNPLMEAAMRVEEERAKMFNAYANHTAHMRAKEAGPPPGMMHMRGGPGPGPGPPPPPQVDLQHVHKKDDSSQSR